MIAPLRKRTSEGKLYTRDPKVETELAELALLSHDDLLSRCMILSRDDPGYVPSECVLYFLRESRADSNGVYFERLYKVLAERVLRRLPKPENPGGETISLSSSRIREETFDRFVELLLEDRVDYSEKLDFYEVRFDRAFAKLRSDVKTPVYRDENRLCRLESEIDIGELSAEVESAVGSYDPFDSSELDAADYRFRLEEAIDTLPAEQRRIVEMIRQGIPIDSKKAEAVTIANTLSRSEKTIRTHRDKAYAVLRAVLTEGEKP